MVKSIQGHRSGLLIYPLQKDALVFKSHFSEDGKWDTSGADLQSSVCPCRRAQEGTIPDRTLAAPALVSGTLFGVVMLAMVCRPNQTGKSVHVLLSPLKILASGSHRPAGKSQLQKEIYGVRSQDRPKCLPLWRREGQGWGGGKGRAGRGQERGFRMVRVRFLNRVRVSCL